MIGSWSNQIIDESRCPMRDRHALDTPNQNVNYVALRLAVIAVAVRRARPPVPARIPGPRVGSRGPGTPRKRPGRPDFARRQHTPHRGVRGSGLRIARPLQ
jgi:hypothetical protein